jgi:hypothetical protein
MDPLKEILEALKAVSTRLDRLEAPKAPSAKNSTVSKEPTVPHKALPTKNSTASKEPTVPSTPAAAATSDEDIPWKEVTNRKERYTGIQKKLIDIAYKPPGSPARAPPSRPQPRLIKAGKLMDINFAGYKPPRWVHNIPAWAKSQTRPTPAATYTPMDRDTRLLTNQMMKYVQLQHQRLQWTLLPKKIENNMMNVAKSITPVGINETYIKTREEAFEMFNRTILNFTNRHLDIQQSEVLDWLSVAQPGDTKLAREQLNKDIDKRLGKKISDTSRARFLDEIDSMLKAWAASAPIPKSPPQPTTTKITAPSKPIIPITSTPKRVARTPPQPRSTKRNRSLDCSPPPRQRPVLHSPPRSKCNLFKVPSTTASLNPPAAAVETSPMRIASTPSPQDNTKPSSPLSQSLSASQGSSSPYSLPPREFGIALVHPSNYKAVWKVEIAPTSQTVIIGSSNMRSMKFFPRSTQVDAFPGIKLQTLIPILKSLKPTPKSSTLVWSVGMNNRDSTAQQIENLLDMVKEIIDTLGFKHVFFNAVSIPDTIPLEQQRKLDLLNKMVEEWMPGIHVIPPLHKDQIHICEHDKYRIHYTQTTINLISTNINNTVEKVIMESRSTRVQHSPKKSTAASNMATSTNNNTPADISAPSEN